MPVTRPLSAEDTAAVAALLVANRDFLAPWQPLRRPGYFTEEGQRRAVTRAVEARRAGLALPMVIQDDGGAVVGTMNLQSIIRGSFQSCSVGYWLAESAQGRGLTTAALREAVTVAFDDLRLHRVQAETLSQNYRSQRVLERLGFSQYGKAESYMQIAGEWQTNVLYQLITPTPERVEIA